MKKYTLFVCFFLSQISQAQNLTNTGFENWAIDSTGYYNPVDWYTSNGEAGSVPTVVQAPGRGSGYCAKLLSVPTINGHYDGSMFYLIIGNYRPKVLSGYWKGTLLPGDLLTAEVNVYNSTLDHLAYGVTYNTDSMTDWTAFQVNIDSVFPGV